MKILVNLITTFRFLYSLLLPILKAKISNVAFLIHIVVLFLSDSIDGILARKYKVQTLYGAVMDTVADKSLCIILAFLLMQKMDVTMMWIVIVNELMILTINCVAILFHKKTSSSLFGKTKMWSLSISIVLSYIHHFYEIPKVVLMSSLVITIILQILTIIHYLISLMKQKESKGLYHYVKESKNIKDVLFNTDYYMKYVNKS